MRSKVTRNQKLFSALLETLGFFSNMCSHVRGQVAFDHKYVIHRVGARWLGHCGTGVGAMAAELL